MGEIVSGVASALLEKLATRAYQEIVLASGLKGDVEKLRETMDFIGAHLVDAENKQVKQQSITKWLQQLKEAFLDASDILDEIECETLRNQVVKKYASVTRKVRRFFSCSNPLAFRIKMSREIREIRDRINEIASIKEKFGLVSMDHRRDDQSLFQTLSWKEIHDLPSRVTGRVQEKEQVINDLMRPNSKDNKIDVIPIVGIGGLGKTTLAQLVCNDRRVFYNFQLLMWVCVSEEFEIKSLMLDILKAAGRTVRDVQSSSLDQVKNLLHEALHGKKFLLVLDNVWNEDRSKWQKLEDVLLRLVDEKNKDSKIIVTTQSHEVASIMGNVAPHNLEGLPKEECQELFFKCAFYKGEEEKYPSLKVVGEEIVVKCKGVLLAVLTLGSLLYSQYDEREWKKIRDSELWELDQSKEGSILSALKLSYNHLPPQLKQCFSLCSIFPEDYEYQSFELVSFWMAHGLLQPNNNKEPEYVGELYIRKLIAISFLQYDYHGITKDGEVIGLGTLKMHDLVHDLALSTMISEQATVINDSKLVNEKVRHLFFSNNASSPFGLNKLNKVQTIISQERQDDEAANFVNWICNQFRYIKVLDLVQSNFQFLPDCLGKMKHLRYLNLGLCSNLEKLPASICKLQNLQWLILFGCEALKELPSNMGKNLVSLRSLMITTQVKDLSTIDIGHLKCLQFLLIWSCDNLVSLPRDLKNLTSLKKLVVANCSKLVRFEDTEDEKEGKKNEALNDFSLQIFMIRSLPKLTDLPSWLTRYATTSLEMLFITDCPEILSLPADMDKLCKLQHLYIVDCPDLEEMCHEGPERTKIAHVTKLHFDYEDSEETEDESEEAEETQDEDDESDEAEDEGEA